MLLSMKDDENSSFKLTMIGEKDEEKPIGLFGMHNDSVIIKEHWEENASLTK